MFTFEKHWCFHLPQIISEEIKLPLIDWAVDGSWWDILSFIEFVKTFSIEVRCSQFPTQEFRSVGLNIFDKEIIAKII